MMKLVLNDAVKHGMLTLDLSKLDERDKENLENEDGHELGMDEEE